MKNFRKTYLALFLASLILFISCNQYDNSIIDEQNIEANKEVDTKLEQELSSSLREESAFKELISIRESITQNVNNNNVSITELKNAYLNQNTEKIKSLLGFSEKELSLMDKKLKLLGEELKNKYPELLEYSSTNTCIECNENKKIEQFFENFDSLTKFNLNETSAAAPGCADYISYTLCLIVCTTTGPVIYWVCAYLCYRSFCPQE